MYYLIGIVYYSAIAYQFSSLYVYLRKAIRDLFTMKRTFFLLFSLLITTISIAQEPICQIKHFSVKDGLAQGIVTTVFQDHKGYLWFSTWNGLNKFDGYTFKNYKSSPQQETRLSNNRITFTATTQYGDIWCLTYDSRAYIFDCHNEIFHDVLQFVESDLKRLNVVQQIYPLSTGVAWLVCDKGYCFRVDEKKYKEKEGIQLYSTFTGELKGDYIFGIYEDSEGDEWILTDKGITIHGEKKIDSDFPFKLITEHQNRVYLISTSDKLAYFDSSTRNIRFIDIPYPIQKINGIKSINNETLALSTDNGAILYKPNEKEFKQIDVKFNPSHSNEALSIHVDSKGVLWIFSTNPGVVRVNPATGERQHLFTPEKDVIKYERDGQNFIFEDSQGTIWVNPYKGNFGYYDEKSKQLKPYYTDPENPRSAFMPFIRHWYADNQGNLWLIRARSVEKMSFCTPTYNHKYLDKDLEGRGFLLDKQKRLWVSSKSGLVRIYNPDNSLLGYLSPQGKISKTKVEFFSNVYCFVEDRKGTIWIGTKTNGLFRLKMKSDDSYSVEQFTHQEDNIYSLSNDDVFSIFIDSQENVWIGTYGGGLNLLREEPSGKIRFIHYKNALRNYPIGNTVNVRLITEARDGVILVGTTGGLITFSNLFNQPEEIKFYQNIHKPADKSSLAGSDVMNIYTDSREDTYVLTFTGGVNKILSENILNENIQFKTYTTEDGLSSDLVLSMIEDADNYLWIVSENSLSKMDAINETFENYDRSFLQNEFSFSEATPIMNNQKNLIFGTDMGMIEVNPKEMKKSSYVPPVVFTDLRINGKQSTVSIDDLNEISLEPSQRNITIHFSAIDYIKPEEIKYTYRLSGLEKEWNESSNNRMASYINLPAGEYKFEVKSTNSDGVWVENMRTLSIKVLPTFWETAWAWIIYLAAFALFTVVIVYVLFYIYRLRHQVDVEQQVSNIKLRFFTDISHELRTPLTLISSPVNEVLEHEPLSPTARKLLSMVHQNTERMIRLVNQILDFRKIQNRKMKMLVEETELISFLKKITDSFRLIADEKQIDYSFHSEAEELFVWIDQDKVEKIVFNLLSNAFKYTLPGKAVSTSVEVQADRVSIIISDEGIGIAPEKQESLFERFETLAKYNILQPSSGIGLSLVKELVEMHHGTITVKSQQHVGSEFCVSLPLDKKVFEKDEKAELILADSYDEQMNQLAMMASQETKEEEHKSVESKKEDAPTLLIVEDNADLRELLSTSLSRDYNIVMASNGEEGLKEAGQIIPDMIISDVMMPVMDGLEMVKAIKENKNICHIPIILLSAKSSLDDRIKGLEQGIDDYITKPFSSTYLKTRISSIFTQRKALQEAFLEQLGNRRTETDWDPSQPQIQSHDEVFMQQVMSFMEEQIDNPELTIDDFANKLLVSRSIFYRKLKSIVGLTPVDFIREIRLKRAAQLIESSSYNFSQIAYMTGFSDPKYFSKCFKKYAGMTPREYKEKNGKQGEADAE